LTIFQNLELRRGAAHMMYDENLPFYAFLNILYYVTKMWYNVWNFYCLFEFVSKSMHFFNLCKQSCCQGRYTKKQVDVWNWLIL